MREICNSGALREGGAGIRFTIRAGEAELPAFAVRFDGIVHAYVNRCAHLGTELDWMPGDFFDAAGLYLICATHGATFEPNTGYCVAGPCKGQALQRVRVEELSGKVYVID
jgi:nitrite reductase/ring-hydroxylating ferredoxin subunit